MALSIYSDREDFKGNKGGKKRPDDDLKTRQENFNLQYRVKTRGKKGHLDITFKVQCNGFYLASEVDETAKE